MSQSPELSRRQRKNLRRWRQDKAIKCRQIEELRQLGLIAWQQGCFETGGYYSAPFLTKLGQSALENRS